MDNTYIIRTMKLLDVCPPWLVIILTFIFWSSCKMSVDVFSSALDRFPRISQHLANEFRRSSINSQDLPVLGFGTCFPELFNKYIAPTKVKKQAQFIFFYNLFASRKSILIVIIILSNIDTVAFSGWQTQTYKKLFEIIKILVVLLV